MTVGGNVQAARYDACMQPPESIRNPIGYFRNAWHSIAESLEQVYPGNLISLRTDIQRDFAITLPRTKLRSVDCNES